MKIAIVSPGTHSVPVVLGTSVEHDIQKTAEQLRSKHRVTVYTKRCREYPESGDEGNLRYERFSFLTKEKYLQQAIAHMQSQAPDIVLVENRPKYVPPIRDAFPNVPIILNMHSAVYASSPSISEPQMLEVSRAVDALLTNSVYLRNFFTERYPELKEKAYAVYMGIEGAPYDPATEWEEAVNRLRDLYGLKKENPVILFVGRLIRQKGLHLLLDVMPKVIAGHPGAKLVVAGSPYYGKNVTTPYVRMIRERSSEIRDHIVWTNFVAPEQIPNMYRLADVVVVPSVWEEPFGRVNLEAMASAKPIIASRRGGIPEVVRHEVNGLLFSITDHQEELYGGLSRLLGSPELRERYGSNGLRLARTYTWSSTAEAYTAVFEACLEKRRF